MKINNKTPRLILFLLGFFVLSTANAQLEWYQKGENINGEADSDNSGWSISTSADGSIVAIGARGNDPNELGAAGHVRVYQFVTDSWVQLGEDIDGEAAGDESGVSVSLSANGMTVAIGAYNNSGSAPYAGQVRIFHFNGVSWLQVGSDIDGEANGDNFGYCVSLSDDGQIVAIGTPFNNDYQGHVRVFTYSGVDWLQMGDDIDGDNAYDFSGCSVSLSSNGLILAVGATTNSDYLNISGQVRVFQFSGTEWNQVGADIYGAVEENQLGYSVSLNADGTILAIGAVSSQGGGIYRGQVRVFEYITDNWIQKGQNIDGDIDNCQAGNAVSLSSDGLTMAVSASFYDGTFYDAGQVKVYKFEEDSWLQIGSSIFGEEFNDQLGHCVSLNSDGTSFAVGVPYNSGGGEGRGSVRVFYSCTQNSGVDVQSACDSFVWIDGITYTENNNTANYTLTNQGGCDSIVSLDLTINTLDIAVSLNESTISAIENGAIYQWVDCNNEYAWLDGEVSQDYTPMSNGSFAVIIEQGACKDTSDCVVLTKQENLDKNLDGIRIFPNPVLNELIIETSNISDANNYQILSTSGQIITSGILEKRTIINASLFASGIYIVKISNADQIHYLKFIKE